MKTIAQFQVSKGETCYVAESVNLPIFTQAETLDELMKNTREATGLYFEGEDAIVSGYTPKLSLFVNFEIPQYA